MNTQTSSPSPSESKIPANESSPSHVPQIELESRPSEAATSPPSSATSVTSHPPIQKTYRGFASWDREKISSAGRKGGIVRRSQLGSMGYSELGRRGGIQSGIKRKQGKEKEKH